MGEVEDGDDTTPGGGSLVGTAETSGVCLAAQEDARGVDDESKSSLACCYGKPGLGILGAMETRSSVLI